MTPARPTINDHVRNRFVSTAFLSKVKSLQCEQCPCDDQADSGAILAITRVQRRVELFLLFGPGAVRGKPWPEYRYCCQVLLITLAEQFRQGRGFDAHYRNIDAQE